MISVVIATKGREESLKRCISSLKKQSFKQSLRLRLKDFEIIVERGGKSLAEARDMGWKKAKGNIVVYIDDDTEVTKDWMKNIVETFKDKKVGGVSGPCIVSEKEMGNRDVFWFEKLRNNYQLPKTNYQSILNFKISNLKTFFWKIIKIIYFNVILEGREKEIGRIVSGGWWTMGSNFWSRARHAAPLQDVDYLEACNMAVRRELIEKAGGFDLGFKGTSEWCEVDLAFRVRKLGYKLVFNPKVCLHHHLSRQGVFSKRANGPERLKNFIRFYIKNRSMICGGTFKYFKFLITVLFMECYFIFKAIKERNLGWIYQ